jgi:hypothetical protein
LWPNVNEYLQTLCGGWCKERWWEIEFLVQHGSPPEIVADLETFNLNVGFPDPRKAPFGFEYLLILMPSSGILQAINWIDPSELASSKAADIQLYNLMEDKGFSDVSFSKGMMISLWLGHFTWANPSVPGTFSPFSFLDINPLSNNQRKWSSILSLVLNSKGNLLKSLDKIKTSCKA